MKCKIAALLVWACLFGAVGAHELEGSRATLILRDQRHVSGVLYINMVDALHLALAPHARLPDFLLMYSSMNLPEFQKELQRVQDSWQQGVQLAMPSHQLLSLSGWTWPQAVQVQRLLQQRMMQVAVAPAEHAHEQPVEVRFEAVAPRAVNSLTSRFPPAFQKVLVVSYQPFQVWVPTDAISTAIRF